jgi:CRISPR system Cascade subunit CasB
MSEQEVRPQVAEFCRRLAALEAGERARLKRCAGKSLGEAGSALALFYRLLPAGVPGSQEETYFAVATLYPLADGDGNGDLGAALRRARNTANGKGLDRRLETLLDADESQLGFRLRQAIHYLQSQRVRLNWPRLLDDLVQWRRADRKIQRQWAHSYFAISMKGD